MNDATGGMCIASDCMAWHRTGWCTSGDGRVSVPKGYCSKLGVFNKHELQEMFGSIKFIFWETADQFLRTLKKLV